MRVSLVCVGSCARFILETLATGIQVQCTCKLINIAIGTNTCISNVN